MKKFYLSIFLCTLIVAIVIGLLTPVAMAASFTPTITASKQTVAEGTEFMVVLKVSNIDAGNGINTLTGTLSYDTDVLETITSSSIEGLNTWSIKYENNIITATKLAFIKQDEDVLQITFKTKTGTTGKQANIKLTGVSAANSENSNIAAADISTSIVVGQEQTQPTSTPISISTPTATATPVPTANTTSINNLINNTNTNTNTNTNAVAKTNKTNNTNASSNRNIAYAGVEDGIVTLGFGVLIIAVLAFWRIHSLKDIK